MAGPSNEPDAPVSVCDNPTIDRYASSNDVDAVVVLDSPDSSRFILMSDDADVVELLDAVSFISD
jgi:hypothetical protein